MVAGVRTQWENMRPYILKRPDVRAHVVEIHPYKLGGMLEMLPIIPAMVKGNVRCVLSSVALFRPPRLDALWVFDIRSALPFLLSKGMLQRTAIIAATDATGAQQAEFGAFYARTVNTRLLGRARNALDAFCWRRATVVNPWSEWAARSLIDDYGVPPQKIQVLAPGIDLKRWPLLARHRSSVDVVRLLFVGGAFGRKGGDLLLDVFANRLRGRFELHVVTRDDVPALPGVRVYRNFSPNDPGLRDLYARCDIFVLPTRADCSPLASLEAMATGLPVITTAIGGIPEIVAEGRSGFLIAPDDDTALAERVEMLAASAEMRARMGLEGRRIVEARFDAAQNTGILLDNIVELCRRRQSAGAGRSITRRNA